MLRPSSQFPSLSAAGQGLTPAISSHTWEVSEMQCLPRISPWSLDAGSLPALVPVRHPGQCRVLDMPLPSQRGAGQSPPPPAWAGGDCPLPSPPGMENQNAFDSPWPRWKLLVLQAGKAMSLNPLCEIWMASTLCSPKPLTFWTWSTFAAVTPYLVTKGSQALCILNKERNR